jgi:hypothetical protein
MDTNETNNRDNETAHRSSSELGAVSWVDALREKVERRISDHEKGDPTEPILQACKLARIDELRRTLKDIRACAESASTGEVCDGANKK